MFILAPIFAVLLAILASSSVAADAGVSVATVTIDGAAQNVLFQSPTVNPAAVVVMFPGGDGRIGIGPNGAIAKQGNFLIRTRPQWLARGFLFVAVDAAERSE